jgi:hypothetical protein
MTTSIQTTRRKDDSVMYEEDKDSVILRLRVELAQERAKRKELALVERDWSRERARTEHALERALVDERVHGLELEASKVFLSKLESARCENDRLTKRCVSSERRLEQALVENVERRKEAKKNERTLKRAVHLSAELLNRQDHRTWKDKRDAEDNDAEETGIKVEKEEEEEDDDEDALYT